jgi:hypothetical protein
MGKAMMKRPKGIVRIFSRGAIVWECRNLFVNAGLPALANLMAGVTAGQYALAVGFGTGGTTPTVNDTDLGASPKYYNAVGAHTFPNSGSVQFGYALLATADYGALGMTVQEVGLFANGSAAAMPAAIGTANPVWASSTARGGRQSDRRRQRQYSALHDSGHQRHDGANVGDDTQRLYHRRRGGLDAGRTTYSAGPDAGARGGAGIRLQRHS